MRSVMRSVTMNSEKRNVPLKHRLREPKRHSQRSHRNLSHRNPRTGDSRNAEASLSRFAAKRSFPLSSITPSSTAPSPALMMDMMSSKNLDLFLLAICSCVLSLLCHQPAGVSTPQAAHFPSSAARSAATPVRVDFLIKAGLMTTRQEDPEVEQDDDLA